MVARHQLVSLDVGRAVVLAVLGLGDVLLDIPVSLDIGSPAVLAFIGL